MRILLSGGTGFIGQKLGQVLANRGHQLVVLTRNPQRARQSLSYPAEVFKWDGLHDSVPPDALKGIEAVIHLAGESIAAERWTIARKRKLRDSRLETTKNLVASLKKADAPLKIFVSASAIGIYGDRGDEKLDEDSALGSDFLAKLCIDWETATSAASQLKSQPRVVQLRTGVVLGWDEGFLAQVVPMFRWLGASRLGSGRQWVSWIHVQDLVNLFVEALENPQLKGAINATAPEPLTNKTLTEQLAAKLGVIQNLPAPRLALKLVYGEMAQLLFSSNRVLPVRAQNAEFIFQFPSFSNALEDLVPNLKIGERDFSCHQWVAKSPEEVFAFFSNAKNLELISPPNLNLRVLGNTSQRLKENSQISYQANFNGLPLNWKSQIVSWKQDSFFVDSQLFGPFSRWRHTHRFQPLASGTLMSDKVIYKLPLGLGGRMAADAFVRSKIDSIFEYRQRALFKIFEEEKSIRLNI